jgi:hypothetical protein
LAVGLLAVIAVAGSLVSAQTLEPPASSLVRVANTDGAELNLRAGPSTSEVVITQLTEGTSLTVTGAAQAVDDIHWLPVKDVSGNNGWVDAQYVAIVSLPAPSPVATATLGATPTELPSVESSRLAAVPTPTPMLSALDVDARLKFPETSGRDQEITVAVTRAGAPVPGAMVTVTTDDGELPFDRPVDPTDADGRTHHAFDIRHEKGTVRLIVKATAPDGGEGTAEASYFRR